jgi:hypothetical protein
MDTLIRGHHSKIAGTNRKSVERKPLRPNKYLQNYPGTKGAICAAEMKDKR